MRIKFLLFAILCLASRLYAGGIIGGGPPAVQDEARLMAASVPDLGLEKIIVTVEDYRRARMRLSASDFATMSIGDRALDLKMMGEAITNITEDAQLYPEDVQN
jgi:hypothetical protein